MGRPTAIALYRVLLRTTQGSLRRLWIGGYRTTAWLSAWYLTRGERGASAYVRAGVGSGDFMPGLSDVDLFLVCDPDPGEPGKAARRIHERFERAQAAFPPARVFLDRPYALESDEVPEVVGANVLTFGLDGEDTCGPRDAMYADTSTRIDITRMAEYPGLYGVTADMRHVRGRRLKLAQVPRDRATSVVACWLELMFWWRVAFSACAGDFGPRGVYLCSKLLSEPAKIWLLLEHGETASGRRAALERAAECLPEEQEAFRLGLRLHREAAGMGSMPLDEVLSAFERISHRIVARVAREATAAGSLEVELIGDPKELIPSWNGASQPDADALPLCDWRALVASRDGDEWFVRKELKRIGPAAIRQATLEQNHGSYTALTSGPLLVLPGPTWERTRRRGIESAVSDPVTHALADGRDRAFFPSHPGFCLDDVTRRAANERRAQLAKADGGTTLAELLLAARAGLVRESVLDGAPGIPITLVATAQRLAERSPDTRTVADTAVAELREGKPTERTKAALRAIVAALPTLRHHA